MEEMKEEEAERAPEEMNLQQRALNGQYLTMDGHSWPQIEFRNSKRPLCLPVSVVFYAFSS